MISELNAQMTITEAVIYLRDGKRKHGMLIEEMINDTYRFISSSNYYLFKKNNDQAYIETVHQSQIDSIDTTLK